jgi:hypothetical protein
VGGWVGGWVAQVGGWVLLNGQCVYVGGGGACGSSKQHLAAPWLGDMPQPCVIAVMQCHTCTHGGVQAMANHEEGAAEAGPGSKLGWQLSTEQRI